MLKANESSMPKNNVEGITRVLNSSENFGFLMESAAIEYTTERKCNLTQIGDLLDDKNYGIAMRQSKYFLSFSLI